ncbi:hybrid sensor histidine kinase/response regulator [Pseudomonas viridiflava]|uniref:ATP-binding protein n=1 Tax=Pseudomonas viridiflava TaxID=33069 RepID=UPI0010BF8D05|nr:ATP-binding protein [Pseudomonas viridiflava]TKJ67222.1 hybrid sensor histidine kinase/response regulator [Pseudomonas viridiflava]TKK18046.1 hybrid sensor histidine kinase/response regulator [Pseudomonas viridiflava]
MDNLNSPQSNNAEALCLPEEGAEIGALLQTAVMNQSPLGHPSQWSDCLKNLIATALPVHAQIVVFWGPQFIALYNDAYAPSIGDKHPGALGRPAIENWGELWDDLEPLLQGVRDTGKTFSAKDRPFYIKRFGAGETVYFNVSYSAVREADGSIGGVLCIVTETTERVQFERRQAFLIELGRTLPSTSDPCAIERHVLNRLRGELAVQHIALIGIDDDGSHLKTLPADPNDSSSEIRHLPEWTDSMSADLRADRAVLHEIAASPIIPANTRMARYTVSEPPCTIYVPVVLHGKLEAVLTIQPSITSTFGDHELDLAQEAAKQAWLWINQARAERALRDLNESLEQRVVTMLAQREKALAQLHESRKMEMVGQLSGGVAHDFNNLLTPIMASLELVRRRVEDPRSTKLLDSAMLAADRARTLVGRLLTFARRQTLVPEAIRLECLVAELKDLIERSLGPMIVVEVDIPDSLPAVFVDPHQLELAILNLTVNARDALEDGGRVRISARADSLQAKAGNHVRLTVSDNGCGMSEDTLKHCVEPFYSTKGVGKGTGLGLSMVQGLALQSGGEFDIRSKPGQGTEVTLWLPVANSPVMQAESRALETPLLKGSVHVLLVDDEDLVRDSTAHLLQDLGYQVTEAPSAAVALDLFDAGLRPDVLVTDYVMADITGVQLARQIRQRINDLPILIITGYTNAKPVPTDDFEILAKPFRRQDIASRLANLVQGGA